MVGRLNLCKKPRFALWSAPRCGTRYLFDVFHRQLGMMNTGMRPNQMQVPTHEFNLPDQDTPVVLAVRNPYLRMLSVWAWAKAIKQIHVDTPFPAFASRLGASLAPPVSARVAGREYAIHHKIRLEHLKEDIAALPFMAGISLRYPRNVFRSHYHNENVPWQNRYTPRLMDFVREHYEHDFKLGGYDPDDTDF
jgi:hypothetical protein